jgi:WD40 repeat protein
MSVVSSLSFSPDGTRLLAGGDATALEMFDVRTGERLGEFRGHDAGILSTCWLANGKTFFSADAGGEVRRWQASPPRTTSSRFQGNYWAENWADMPQTRSICISDDGKFFAAPINKDTFRISSTFDTNYNVRHKGEFPLAFDGRELIALTSTGTLNRYEAAPESLERRTLLPSGASVSCATLSANRRVLAAGSATGQLWLWKYPSLEAIADIRTDLAVVWVAASPAGNIVAANARDNIVRAWSAHNGNLIAQFTIGGGRRAALGASISPDEKQMAICLQTGEIEIHSLDSHDTVHRFRTDSARLYATTFSPDGGRLYCSGSNGTVHVYATIDWRLISTLSSPAPVEKRDNTIIALSVSASGNALIAYRTDGTIRVWHVGPTSL